MGTCCMKKKNTDPVRANAKYDKKMSPEERERRRQQQLEAAQKRQQDSNLRGISKQTHQENELKIKRQKEAEKNAVIGEKSLQWKM